MGNSIKIGFLGDIMPGGVLHGVNDGFVTVEVLKLLKEFDIRIATLECAFGDNIPFIKEKMVGKQNIIWAPNSDIEKLKVLNINVVTLANNHVFDLGCEGLRNTIDILDNMGIKHCGAGMNIQEATRPAVVEIAGKTIAFLSYCSRDHVGYIKIAAENDWGIACLENEEYPDHIKKAKQLYDYVFVLPHWGKEVVWIPPVKCRKIGMRMINSGADGVIGNHPHQIQPIVHFKGKPIVFSLGNFLFPDFYMQPPRPIWYPDKDYDLSSIKKTYAYPKNISEPYLKLWKDFRNISLLVNITLTDQIITRYNFVKLENTIVKVYKPTLSLRVKMKLSAWLCNTPLMTLAPFYRRVFSFFERNIIKRLHLKTI